MKTRSCPLLWLVATSAVVNSTDQTTIISQALWMAFAKSHVGIWVYRIHEEWQDGYHMGPNVSSMTLNHIIVLRKFESSQLSENSTHIDRKVSISQVNNTFVQEVLTWRTPNQDERANGCRSLFQPCKIAFVIEGALSRTEGHNTNDLVYKSNTTKIRTSVNLDGFSKSELFGNLWVEP